MNNELKAILDEILIELRSINKKLDAVTPSLVIDNKKIIDGIGQSVESAIRGTVSLNRLSTSRKR